jgi:hypothetical protein
VFFLRKPSNYRDWSADQAILPRADVKGDRVRLFDIRNCSYTSPKDFVVRHYDKTFDLARIESVFFIVEPFLPRLGLAHTFLSFGFEGPEYIAISVEIRKCKGQQFSALKGLMRNYEIMYVIGDEKDLVKLRTSFRRDAVYLYPARAPRDKVRQLFLSMIRRANDLYQHPEFYNTLTNTCTTNIVRHINLIAPNRVPFHLGINLPAFSDRLAHRLGLIDTDLPFEAAQRRFFINERALRYADHPDFSAKIRDVER